MKWNINTSTEPLSLTREQLLDMLMSKVISSTKPEFTTLVSSFNNFLQSKKTMSTCNIDQLMTMGFTVGYYYRVFLEKNNEEIIGEELDDNVVESSDNSTNNQNPIL